MKKFYNLLLIAAVILTPFQFSSAQDSPTNVANDRSATDVADNRGGDGAANVSSDSTAVAVDSSLTITDYNKTANVVADSTAVNNKKKAAADKTKKQQKKKEVYYLLPADRTFAHWSWGIKVGGSMFDGDVFEANGEKLAPTTNLHLTLGANIERTFNPSFGVGIQYSYIPYGGSPDEVIYDLDGTSHEVDAYLSLNLLNILYPERRGQRWGLFMNAGMGMAFYKAKMTDKKTGEVIINKDKDKMDLTNGKGYMWPISLNLEYNISKRFAVGAKIEYRMHSKDNFEGYSKNVRQGNTNDAFSIGAITFRHKILGGEEYHTRNICYGMNENLEKRLAELEKLVAAIPKQDTSCCNCCETIEKKLDEILATPPPPPPAPAPVPEVVPSIEERAKRVNLEMRGIKFETDKDIIKPESYPIVDNVATIMLANPTFQLEIIGHTDTDGSMNYNLDLSDRRAKAVRRYLINKGIDENRLSALGKGYLIPVATNSTAEGKQKNRRVQFIVKDHGDLIYDTDVNK